MATLFAQSIIQFAPLRIFARMHTTIQHTQLIRELFPKALFDEQNATYKLFIEIAWSFLSDPVDFTYYKNWYSHQAQEHRVGGLPAIIYAWGAQIWYKDGKRHCSDKDPRTGLTFPAAIWSDGSQWWCKNDKPNRDDKDLRTGLTLPAIIWKDESQEWYKNGKRHRDDKDPQTGLTLPALINVDGLQEWWKDGEQHRDDKDPQTGLTLPAKIYSDGSQVWYRDKKIPSR